jgi:hypothetical protein
MAPCELGCIETGDDVFFCAFRREQIDENVRVDVVAGGREKLEAVIVERHAEGERHALAEAPGEEGGEARMHLAP